MLWHMSHAYDIDTTFVNLGQDGSTDLLEVTPSFWPDLVGGKLGAGPGRLVSSFTFEGAWDNWEVHPNGDEIVVLVEGAADMRFERADGSVDTLLLDRPGSFIFVERGTWHTGCGVPSARMIFITDGEGTDHRPAE